MEWLTSTLFGNLPFVGHAFLTRSGGHSTGPFEGLNCSPWVGDEGSSVDQNLEMIRNRFGLDQLQIMHQVHGTAIICADGKLPMVLGESDGCWTRDRRRGLLVLHADCQPILIADGEGRAVMAIHAGWRGLMRGILPVGLRELQRIGCSLEKAHLVIGPSLGPSSAEFIHYKEEFPEWAWGYRQANDRFNLWQIAKDQACSLGVPSDHIEVIGVDTMQDPRFFSYRRSATTGRNGSLIWLH